MAGFGSTNSRLNTLLREATATTGDWDEAEKKFLAKVALIGSWPCVLATRACHDNADGAGKQTGAFMQGMAEAYRKLGHKVETATAIVSEPKRFKRPQRVFVLVRLDWVRDEAGKETQEPTDFAARLQEMSKENLVEESWRSEFGYGEPGGVVMIKTK